MILVDWIDVLIVLALSIGIQYLYYWYIQRGLFIFVCHIVGYPIVGYPIVLKGYSDTN